MRTKKGLSLAEVVISCAVFTIIVLSMLQIFSRGFQYYRKAKFRLPAYNMARAYTEYYYDWANLSVLDGTADAVVTNGLYDLTNLFARLFESADTAFTCNISIIDGPVEPAKLKQYNVTVTWPEGSFKINALKANY